MMKSRNNNDVLEAATNSQLVDSEVNILPCNVFTLFQVTTKRKKNSLTSHITPKKDIIDFEIKMYLTDAESSIETDCPLKYWTSKRESLPELFRVAVAVLTIPATSAPAERVFSRASIVLDKQRHNLSDKMLETEVFYNMNRDV